MFRRYYYKKFRIQMFLFQDFDICQGLFIKTVVDLYWSETYAIKNRTLIRVKSIKKISNEFKNRRH